MEKKRSLYVVLGTEGIVRYLAVASVRDLMRRSVHISALYQHRVKEHLMTP